jgi:predicted ATPase
LAHDVFICHASQDAAFATAVCERLEKAGIRCWIAPRDPVAGIPYARQLIEAVNGSRILLLLLSESSNKSQHVLRELEIASQSGATILPVRIADVPPAGDIRYYITAVHWLDATAPPIADRLDEIARLTANLLETGKWASASAETPEEPEDRPRTNLPPPLSTFVGRENTVVQIAAIARQCRLVTLSGPGGVGKTRCAVEAGRLLLRDFDDGVWLIDLASVRDPDDVSTLIATTMDLPVSTRSGIPGLAEHLCKRNLLIVLDNCEHVIDAVRDIVVALEHGCEKLAILATSREALNLYGEQLYPMPSLDVPPPSSAPDPAELLNHASVRLFVDRAVAGNATFTLTRENAPYVAEICRRLDGIPLAIELAAARVKLLAPRQLAQRLAERIGELSAGGKQTLARQHTLRAAFEWSYDLLSEKERMLLRRLAVFVGTFTFEMASAVCSDEKIEGDEIVSLLESLVHKSVVQTELVGEFIRHRLLESVREYANEKLQGSGETASMLSAHAREYAKLAAETYQGWVSAPDAVWLPQAISDLANFRAALKWAFSEGGDVLTGQQLAGSLRSIWSRLDAVEGRNWIREALSRVTDDTPPMVVAQLHVLNAQLSAMLADYSTALPSAERAAQIFSVLNDESGLAEGRLLAGAATSLLGDPAQGKILLSEALATFRKLRADRQIGSALQYLAITSLISNDIDSARELFSEALLIFRSTPGADQAVRHMATALAEVELQSGDPESALKLGVEALEADRAMHEDVLLVFDLCNVCAYLIALSRFEEAAALASEALDLSLRVQVDMGATVAFQRLAAIAAARAVRHSETRQALRQTAARLIGYVDARMSASQARRDYTEQQEYDKTRERLAAALGADRVEALCSEGCAWTESEAAAAARWVAQQ